VGNPRTITAIVEAKIARNK